MPTVLRVGLEDVRFHAPHGFYPEEQLVGNEFSIDLTATVAVGGAAEDDELAATADYASIYALLGEEMQRPTRLLEALAYRMARRVLKEFTGVTAVRLRIRKLHPPLGGRVGAAFVEVVLP